MNDYNFFIFLLIHINYLQLSPHVVHWKHYTQIDWIHKSKIACLLPYKFSKAINEICFTVINKFGNSIEKLASFLLNQNIRKFYKICNSLGKYIQITK